MSYVAFGGATGSPPRVDVFRGKFGTPPKGFSVIFSFQIMTLTTDRYNNIKVFLY